MSISSKRPFRSTMTRLEASDLSTSIARTPIIAADTRLRVLVDMAHALGDDNDVVAAAVDAAAADHIDHIMLEIDFLFGKQHGGSAGSQGGVEREMAGVAAHDLYDRHALVALPGVAQLVDGLDRGVAGGIKADGILGAAHVVIDRRGDTHDADPPAGQLQRAAVSAVAADGDETVDAKIFADFCGFVNTGFRAEFLAAGGIENGTAAAGNAVYVVAGQLKNIAVDESGVTSADADAGDPLGAGGAHNGADRGVHAGGVAAARQDADSVCSCHK